MAAIARKISGVAAPTLSSAKLILFSRPRRARFGDVGVLAVQQRRLVRLDQVIDRWAEDRRERAGIDTHPEHDQDQRHEQCDLPWRKVQELHQVRLLEL